MDGEIIETVTGWESEPLSGGTDGLRGLQSREFTGAVTEGHAWLFMLNGRIVGVFDGTVESFEDADGTAYVAPDPSFPLLYAMQETGGETKARYYTNDTALSAADAKLSSGKFTGYIELSENVLSGDYYIVYYGGRRLACAFVGTGQTKNVLTGDEAFSAADDEVGIYEVVDVDIDVVDLPEADPEPADDEVVAAAVDDPEDGLDEAPADAATDSTGSDSVTFGDPGSDDDATGDSADMTAENDTATDAVTDAAADAGDPASSWDDDTAAGAVDGAADGTSETAAREAVTDAATDAAVADTAVSDESAAGVDESPPDPLDDGASSTDADAPAEPVADPRSSPQSTAADTDTVEADEPSEPTDANGDPFSAEEQWRETRSIPSLDPSRTATPEEPTSNGAAGSQRRPSGDTARRTEQSTSETTGATRTSNSASQSQAGGRTDAGQPTADAQSVAAVREELQTVRKERDRARDVAREAREQLDASESELGSLREENDRLSARVEELEAQLSSLREELQTARASGGGDSAGGTTSSTQSMPADRALTGTNLFVRYDTKGGATLEKAHAGGATRSDVNDNLRLEVHTEFDAADVAVDGQPFREFLGDTIEYGFVEWAVRELLYEIQSTGNESALRDLFDAIPEIDRAELYGTVTVESDTGETSEHTFDVVLRDRMGNPLLVADVTEGRDATTESMLDSLVGDSSAVADADEHLAASFYVTASYFEPGALEAAADATGGGLLSRGKRKSFVKLSRKQGFHLCLVESREGEFHVNVPEL